MNLQRQTDGWSGYRSLQVRGMRCMAGGIMIQLTYTWSKLMDELRFIDPANPAPSRMIGEFDNPHRVTFAGIWELHFGRDRRFARRAGAAVPLGTAALATGTSPKLDGRTIDGWFNRSALPQLPAFTPRTIPY